MQVTDLDIDEERPLQQSSRPDKKEPYRLNVEEGGLAGSFISNQNSESGQDGGLGDSQRQSKRRKQWGGKPAAANLID